MSKSRRPHNVNVKLGRKIRNFEQLVRRFMKKCKEEGIIHEVKERSFYESRAQKKRRKKHSAKMRHKKKQGLIKR